MAEDKPWLYGYEKVKKDYEDKRRYQKPITGRITSIKGKPLEEAAKFEKRNRLIDKATGRLRRVLPGQDADEK